jgi:energy-coupling factor transport system ATP-binding protein
MNQQNIVSVENLSFRYLRGTDPALKKVSFHVKEGEFIGITGSAGAGKTTILSCINGIIPHYFSGDIDGSITLDGLDVAKSNFRQLAGHVGTVFEDPDFQMVSVTVEEELAFGPENLGIPREEIESRVQDALKKTRIAPLRDRAITTLSGGQKQRVAIASVLTMQPKVLLLDEPTSELDPIGTHEVFSALSELNKLAGITVILVSQEMELLVECADRILLISKGELILDAAPRQVCLMHKILEEVGARVPQVAEYTISLYNLLGRTLTSKDIPLTVEEATTNIRRLIKEAGVV